MELICVVENICEGGLIYIKVSQMDIVSEGWNLGLWGIDVGVIISCLEGGLHPKSLL